MWQAKARDKEFLVNLPGGFRTRALGPSPTVLPGVLVFQPGLELVPVWDICIAGRSLMCYTMITPKRAHINKYKRKEIHFLKDLFFVFEKSVRGWERVYNIIHLLVQDLGHSCQGWTKAKPGAWNSSWVPRYESQGPNYWTIFCCLPRLVSMDSDWKWNSLH